MTARVRRSSSGASSRNAYGLAFRISCAKHGRLGRLARHGADLAVGERLEHARRPCGVHRLDQAVAHRLAHQRVVGDLDRRRRRGCPGSRAGRGRPRRADPPRACAGAAAARAGRPGSAASASERVAFQRQRVSNIGACSAACVSSSLDVRSGAASRRPISSGKLCCGPSESSDAVVGGRRLELEVEGLAEALAQRHAPGAVDPAAERRVDDELHAARLVEEALGDDACLRRHGAERGARRRRRSRAASSAPAPVERARRPSSQRDGSSSGRVEPRRRSPRAAPPTSADSSRVRAGPSPSQNGMVGAAPSASSTRTLPASTRRMRHEVLPSRMMSPAMDSMAKSSSTVPISVSSGSSTTS